MRAVLAHSFSREQRMKIAILTTDNREHEKNYGVPAPYFGTAPEALLQGFATIPEAEVHVVSCTRQPMQSPAKLADNVWFHSLHVPRLGWTATCFQGCIRAARRFLKNLQPDIVHGQGTERDCALSAVFSGFPNVITVHGNMGLIAKVNHARLFSFYGQAAALEKIALRRTAGVVCITRYTQEAVKDLVPKTWVLPNAVDASFFDVKAAPETPPIILCVGLVCYRKNQNVFIKALDELAARLPFKIVFLGQAKKSLPYAAEFFELLASRPWCEYAGFADREKLKTWFQKARLLALPSLEDNCPMVVLEAMAARVPVMAAKVGGVPELISGGETGLFCDPHDAASMSAAVAQLLEDAPLAQRLVQNARISAQERFHPTRIAQAHMEIYREVLSRPA